MLNHLPDGFRAELIMIDKLHGKIRAGKLQLKLDLVLDELRRGGGATGVGFRRVVDGRMEGVFLAGRIVET